METSDLTHLLTSDAFTRRLTCAVYDGVHAADQLHVPLHRPTALVINTDPSWKPGKHWVAVYIPIRGPWEYFDSYGEPPLSPFIRQWIDPHPYIYNNKLLQSPVSDVCGQYCMYYLMHRARGQTMDAILSRFTNNADCNDADVRAWAVHHFYPQ